MSCTGACALLAFVDASGFAPLEEGAALESLDLDMDLEVVALRWSVGPGTRSGEFAIVLQLPMEWILPLGEGMVRLNVNDGTGLMFNLVVSASSSRD